MRLPVTPPVAPMLAKLARTLPAGEFTYEPKWDGFRCLAFRDADVVDLRSRNDRPFARYFPELVEALVSVDTERFVIDGEIVVTSGEGLDFDALMLRLHPSRSRVERLRRETPASFVAFDVLAVGDEDLRGHPFCERRRRLEQVLEGCGRRVLLTPTTADREVAMGWLEGAGGPGVDGVVAKHADLRYQPGRRAMVKVKPERTADCVVGGCRLFVDPPAVASLLLGLYDENATLRHVGVASSFTKERRRELLTTVAPFVVPLEGHPWAHGFALEGGPMGRLPGAAGQWDPSSMAHDWVPLAPQLVCEVAYDQVDGYRWRHPARFRRWRPDRDAASCSLDQLVGSARQSARLLPT